MMFGQSLPPCRMPIYVVSMKEDFNRRYELRLRFPESYDRFIIVDAVDLRDKHLELREFEPRAWGDPAQMELTKRQVGCALSHVGVLKSFVKSETERCLVLEDDVIGDDESLLRIQRLMDRLPRDSFVLLGGQEGLKGRRYLTGSSVAGTEAWWVPPISRHFIARTVAYAVTRSSAEAILKRQEQSLDHPDHWSSLLRGYRNVYFAEILKHPQDLENSHMEAARLVANSRSRMTRLIEDGVWETAVRNAAKLVIHVGLPFPSLQPIPFV